MGVVGLIGGWGGGGGGGGGGIICLNLSITVPQDAHKRLVLQLGLF